MQVSEPHHLLIISMWCPMIKVGRSKERAILDIQPSMTIRERLSIERKK
jgi:hypothetical protein